MTFLVILVILFALVFLGQGVLLLLSNKWLPKLETLMWSKPPEPSAIARIGVWKLRALGIFNILASIYLFLEVVTPSAGRYIPFVIALMLTALIANFVLGVVWALQIKNEKASPKKLP